MNDDPLRHRLLAVASSTDDSDWLDVRRRAARIAPEGHGRRGWSRRRLVLVALAALAVLIVVNSAFGLGERLLGFVEGDPAPEPVKEELARGSEPPPRYTVEGHVLGPPKPVPPPVELENAHLAIARQTSVGPVYLWVAPTAGGGDCRLLQIPALSAGRGGQRPANVECHDAPTRERPIEARWAGLNLRVGPLSYASGRVLPGIVRLELLLSDGATMRVPVSKGYYFAELPSPEPPSAKLPSDPGFVREPGSYPIREYRGFDADGKLVARVSVPEPPPISRPVEPYKTAITIRLKSGREASIEFARGERGTLCWRQRSPGGVSTTCQRVPSRSLPTGLAGYGGPNVDQLVLLGGPVGSEIARVDLVYDDGSTERLPIGDGFVLKQVDEGERGRWPVKLIGRDDSGQVIAEGAVR